MEPPDPTLLPRIHLARICCAACLRVGQSPLLLADSPFPNFRQVDLCDELARQGFVAVAPDTFGGQSTGW